MKGVVYKACVHSMFDVWGKDLGDEGRGVSKAVGHRVENVQNGLQSDIEGYGREYGDCIDSGSGRSRVAFEAEKMEVVWTYCKKR